MIMGLLNGVTKGDILRYMLMPQIVPRIRAFAKDGFINLAVLIASVYRSLGLLPVTHPILLPHNRQHLSLRGVIAAAASELKYTWSNADKVIVFYSILVGLVMLVMQFAIMIGYVMINPALASNMPTDYGAFFMDPNLEKDVAYLLLFIVFGVPEIFRPGEARTDFHSSLHELFQLYSIGLLVVAVIIICYYIFAVVVETAQTGVPFGKRYDHVWTPIRLVFALGLLIPVGYGLNSAQWITLYFAKFGSDFATKGWVLFNETMNESYLSDPEERVGTPKVPNVKPLAAFMTQVLACQYVYEKLYPLQQGSHRSIDIQAYVISDATSEMAGPPQTLAQLAYEDPREDTGQVEARDFRKDVLIRFGEYNPSQYTNEKGHVFSLCGDLVISFGEAYASGSAFIQKSYLTLVNQMWTGSQYGLKTAAELRAEQLLVDGKPGIDPPQADMSYADAAINEINEYLKEKINSAVDLQASSEKWQQDQQDIRDRGWGGAGMWYNQIAHINGDLVNSVANIPSARRMPYTMEYVRMEQLQQNQELADLFGATMADGREIEFTERDMAKIHQVLKNVYDDWAKDPNFGDLGSQTQITGNIVVDSINLIFGTQGLFAMCQNTEVHPLAQLSQLGKGLVEASIRNLGTGIAFGAGATIQVPFLGPVAGAASSMLTSVASITIVMGFLLYYVMPFMPFLYFFFAVGGWIKGLFEAMVGVPLWALAFLKIDGEGLPGDAAMNGIYMIFEIFLRPLLIVFGLLASVVIFAAMVKVLNEIFYLVVQNVAGHDPNSTAICGGITNSNNTGSATPSSGNAMDFFRGPIDELFFTIMYAIVVYMIGMSCFKLIDLVPNNILRYMGASVNTFNDKASDPAEGLMMRLSIGGNAISEKTIGGNGMVGNVMEAAGGFTQAGIRTVNPPQNG